jgi:hypothetical protein
MLKNKIRKIGIILIIFGGFDDLLKTLFSYDSKGMKDKLYDPKVKRKLERTVFSLDRCSSISNLYSQVQTDLKECQDKSTKHNQKLAEIMNNHGGQITYVTSGAGGGGGSPVRSIASIIESEAQMNLRSDSLIPNFSEVTISRLQKETDLCQVLAPAPLGQQGKAVRRGSVSEQ